MRYYAKRTHCGVYTLEQETDDGMVYKQIVGRDTINSELRVRLDAVQGERIDALETSE